MSDVHLDVSANSLGQDGAQMRCACPVPLTPAPAPLVTPLPLYRSVLLGLGSNSYVSDVHLDVSANSLGQDGAQMRCACPVPLTPSPAPLLTPLPLYRSVLLGLGSNSYVSDVHLDVSANSLGQDGAQMLEMCMPRAVVSIDISNNGQLIVRFSICLIKA